MNSPSHTTIAVSIGMLIVITQVTIGYLVYVNLPDWPTRGQFGDVFGAVNALFSGLAFAGLIYTVFLQREELALQRKELELTRQELKRTALAQEQSEMALRAQANAAARTARLATTNALLDHYRNELSKLEKDHFLIQSNDPRRTLVKDLRQREEVLLDILNSMYMQITSKGKGDEQI